MTSTDCTSDGFTSKWGFILACIGSAVGMGNIWRFPVMVSTWGGLTFLLPYFFFVALIASTGVIEEFALGRSTGHGPVGAFGACTKARFGTQLPGKLIGLLPVFGSFALAVGYTVVAGWIFRYAYLSITGQLFSLGTDLGTIAAKFSETAPEANSIAQSAALVFSGAGNPFWLVFGLITSLSILALGIAGGIEKANKLMMPVLFVLFLGLAVYVSRLPGVNAGYRYLLTLNPRGLLNPRLWIFAFGQAFFSLSVAGNGSVIYGAYLPKHEDLISSAKQVAVFDTLAALLAAFVIIPAMSAGGAAPESGGPGLMFIYLVNVFNGMPGGRIVGIVFFICILFAGISSIINLYEAPVATLQEVLGMRRLPAVLTAGTFGCGAALLIQGVTSQWMDAVSIYICPFGAMLAGILFFWCLKEPDMLRAVNEGAKKPVGQNFIRMGRFVYIPLSLLALIAGALLGGIG